MVRPLSAQSHARAVRQPEPATFRLPLWDLQPLAPLDPLDPLVVDHPARVDTQQLGDFPVAVAAVLARQLDDVGCQPLFVVSPRWNAPLSRAVLSEHTAHPTLGQLQLMPDLIDARPAARGA